MAVPAVRELANCVRVLAMDAVERAASGHPGMPLGMADAATVLFTRFLKYDAAAPEWPDRDRFILSNGHGSMLQYALLHLTGYEGMDLEQLRNFRQLGSRTPGHPEHGETPGVEVTTGPLGQGLGAGVGMALAERLLAAELGDDLVDHRTWVFAGDGCLMEGVGQEAMSLAGHLGLGKLIVVFDDNAITIDGATSLSRSEDVRAKAAACGWRVLEADGHDPDSIAAAYAAAIEPGEAPVFINLATVIGWGAPTKRGTAGVHGTPLGAEEVERTRQELGWEHGPFEIPAPLLEAWRAAGRQGAAAREAWEGRWAALPEERRREGERRLAGRLPLGFAERAREFCAGLVAAPQAVATRKASQTALDFLVAELPELVGGSADLTGSNLTQAKGMEPCGRDGAGRYVHYGVREFAMAAAMNGLALHGGLLPYGGTFLVFSDYARNAIRLAAMMRLRAVYVLTHDSIGLGEDGPTHQPVEHLAALRAIPGLRVFRPADAVETFECWLLALAEDAGPSVLALTRQGVPQLRAEDYPVNRCAAGAYVLAEPDRARDLTILATGSEVALALEAAKELEADGVAAAVVSMPCWELFEEQEQKHRESVLGAAPRLAVEAAGKFGWSRYVADERRDVVGIDGFGVSAPAADAYRHFGITAADIAARGRELARGAD
ncbi:MAG: transketolase [Betaproteobacteria bacterium AqS2]|uniref:Transketolase n=1 Tax=Candidatus Amphirhobacter heronislandensis TaxID=1732024 RepID=A0A930UD19_9GAMM|nr:transketolase [Betaproteobacteria bacterium AqS2]